MLIKDALSTGELTPTRGVGEPIPNLDRDPMWWVKSLLRRENAADGLGEIISHRDHEIDRAVKASDLSEARAILQSLNRDVIQWNEGVDEEHHLDPLDEIWLLTERQKSRPQSRNFW